MICIYVHFHCPLYSVCEMNLKSVMMKPKTTADCYCFDWWAQERNKEVGVDSARIDYTVGSISSRRQTTNTLTMPFSPFDRILIHLRSTKPPIAVCLLNLLSILGLHVSLFSLFFIPPQPPGPSSPAVVPASSRSQSSDCCPGTQKCQTPFHCSVGSLSHLLFRSPPAPSVTHSFLPRWLATQ